MIDFPEYVDASTIIKGGKGSGKTIERSYAQPTLLDTVKDSVPDVNQKAYSLADAFIRTAAGSSGTLPGAQDGGSTIG